MVWSVNCSDSGEDGLMGISENIVRFTEGRNPAPPQRLGQRYSAERFLPEAGNTVVCHLDHRAPAHQAVLEARARMQALPGADRFLYTPVDSLHMTLFEGAIETRRTADGWPAGLDRNAPIESVTEAVREKLQDFAPLPGFAVRAVDLHPTGLSLDGATPEDTACMRAWRDALTAPFGYRHDDHDDYRFHMTFAYPIDWIPDAVAEQWSVETAAILKDLAAAAPQIPLRSPAFCTFADMTAFPEVLELEPAPAG